MGALKISTLGRSGVKVTQLGLGGAPLGDIVDVISEEQAQRTLQAAWDGGIRFYDTSPFYGYGKSEHRMGTFLRQQPRCDFVVSTKVGRVFHAPRRDDRFDGRFWVRGKPYQWRAPLPFEHHFDYSYDGILRSHEDSLLRLSLPWVDLLVIHDLDRGYHNTDEEMNTHRAQLLSGGWKALEELRSDGRIRAVGIGINDPVMIPELLDLIDIDFMLLGFCYTLLDHGFLRIDGSALMERGIGVFMGAVYGSGILATGAVKGASYMYAPALPEVLDKVRRIEAVCRRHETPIGAAALQFPLWHPLVAAVIPGAVSPEQVRSNGEWIQHPIPGDLWSELKAEGLLPEDAPTP